MFAALTPAGHAKLVEAAPDHVASVRNRFFKGLTREQVRAARRHLRDRAGQPRGPARR